MKTNCLCDKLDYYRLRPFVICEQINLSTYLLHLLESIKIHHIFHLSLLEPYKSMNISRIKKISPLLIKFDNNQEIKIEEILNL